MLLSCMNQENTDIIEKIRITTDVLRRYNEHLTGIAGHGAKYTNANKPVKILYTKEYETKSEAMKEEYRIKRLTRAKKLELVEMQD